MPSEYLSENFCETPTGDVSFQYRLQKKPLGEKGEISQGLTPHPIWYVTAAGRTNGREPKPWVPAVRRGGKEGGFFGKRLHVPGGGADLVGHERRAHVNGNGLERAGVGTDTGERLGVDGKR